ncbi:hypothetical protein ACFL3E_00150 [Patescibacteria group bacterium]
MANKAKKENILFAGAIIMILILAAVWFFVIRKPSEDQGAVFIEQVSPSEILSQDILRTVDMLQKIKLSTSIFEDERFLHLEKVQERTEIEIPKGRTNPFKF